MLIYIVFKSLRRDYRHWLRINGPLGLFASLLMRLVVKFVNDFTLNPQFRHQMDLGGAYWTFNMIAHQLFCFVSVYLLQEYGENVDEARVNALWIIVSTLFVITNVNFGWFLTLINKKYLITFFDTRTGQQFLCDVFRNAKSDGRSFMSSTNTKVITRASTKRLKNG